MNTIGFAILPRIELTLAKLENGPTKLSPLIERQRQQQRQQRIDSASLEPLGLGSSHRRRLPCCTRCI